MANLSNLDHIWSTITEVDTTAIRDQTQRPLRLALLGSDGEAIHWLHDMLRTDPITQGQSSLSQSIWVYQLPADEHMLTSATSFDLALVVRGIDQADLSAERRIAEDFRIRSPHLPVVSVRLTANLGSPPESGTEPAAQIETQVCVDCDHDTPGSELAQHLLQLFPDGHVWLGHHLPGLRPAICRSLIKETSIANAGYAASTGVAELVPILFIPVNIADMIVLSKNQALLAYKLALILGRDIAVTEMAVELAGVLGSGFIWREAARTLVGWIPGIGIVPKIGVAYAGTYVIGEAVYVWYGYGKRLSPEQIRDLFAAALVEGRQRARAMLPEQRPALRLPAVSRPSLPRRPALRRTPRRCPNCQRRLRRKDHFCSNCGFSVIEIAGMENEQTGNLIADP